MPHTVNLAQPQGPSPPCPPLPPAAPAEAAPPAPPVALPTPGGPLPPPRHTPCRPRHPRRARPGPAPRQGRAACGQGRERAGANRGGAATGPRARARPSDPAAARPEPHLPTPYFSSSVGVHMAKPGAAPRARRPGDSAAGTAAGPAVAHRKPKRGRSGGAGQGAAHPSQAVRDAAATSEPQDSCERPSSPGRRGRGLSTCPSPLLPRRRSVPHSSAVRLPAPPRFGSPQRARGTAAHAPLPARGVSRCPGSRRPSPRASPRAAAAARQRREIRERRLDCPAEVRSSSYVESPLGGSKCW